MIASDGLYWFDKAMVDEAFVDWVGMAGKFPWESWILSKRDWPRRHGVVKQYYGPFKNEPGAGSFFLNYNDTGNTRDLRAFLDRSFPSPCRFENTAVVVDLPTAPLPPGAGSGCYPRPDLSQIRLVLLSPEHYATRRAGFVDSLRQNGGFLNEIPLEWWKGTPSGDCYAPPTFKKIRSYKHWWSAGCDHLRIMEESLARGDDYLLLFEDDARFDADFEERFWLAWRDLPPSWKAMRLGWRDHGNSVRITENLHRCGISGGLMLGNLWNHAGLKRAYDHFWRRREMVIDDAFSDLRKKEPDDWFQPARPVVAECSGAGQCGMGG